MRSLNNPPQRGQVPSTNLSARNLHKETKRRRTETLQHNTTKIHRDRLLDSHLAALTKQLVHRVLTDKPSLLKTPEYILSNPVAGKEDGEKLIDAIQRKAESA